LEHNDITIDELVDGLIEAVAGDLKELARWLVEHRQSELRALEDGLREKGHRLLCGLLEETLAQEEEVRREGSHPCCAQCGQQASWLGQRSKRMHLLLGEVVLPRCCYYCAQCHTTWAPLDQQLGIDQSGRSPRLVEAIALLGAELPFSPAGERLAQLCGVTAGPSQIEEVTEGIGQVLHQQELDQMTRAFEGHQLPPVENRYPWLVLALDGVMAPYRDGYHEVRVAAIGGVAWVPQDWREASVEWRYVVDTGDVATLGKLAWLESYRQGLEEAKQVLVLGDGASWIWNLAEEHWPGAVQILDFYHATEHLWALGRSLWGEGSSQVKPWVEAAKEGLEAGKVEELLTQWRDLHPQDPEGFARELTYFGNQRRRMKYDEYRAAGYPIGSGAVESANRHVVGVRVKQAGMRWLEPGIKGVLALRAMLRSQRWSQWWDQQPLPIPLAV
jgi:hypothetical protein